MWQMGELPDWVEMGEDEDFASPAISLAEQLKKKMTKSTGGPGGGLGGGLSEMADMPKAGMSAGGPKSF